MLRDEPVVQSGGVRSSSKGELSHILIKGAPDVSDVTSFNEVFQTEPGSFVGASVLVAVIFTSSESVFSGVKTAVQIPSNKQVDGV